MPLAWDGIRDVRFAASATIRVRVGRLNGWRAVGALYRELSITESADKTLEPRGSHLVAAQKPAHLTSTRLHRKVPDADGSVHRLLQEGLVGARIRVLVGAAHVEQRQAREAPVRLGPQHSPQALHHLPHWRFAATTTARSASGTSSPGSFVRPAAGILSGDFRQSEYGKVIPPFYRAGPPRLRLRSG